MPLFYQQNINENTKLAIWKIEEDEFFFDKNYVSNVAIKHTTKRIQHIAGRYLLQLLYPELPIHAIIISTSNKPFLKDESFYFSISHTSNYVAAIVSKTNKVGIDVEINDDRIFNIKNKFLSEAELTRFKCNTLNNTTPLLTLLWCCKETIFKWWGKGNVDFKKMIEIKIFNKNVQGSIDANFCDKSNKHYPLQLQYKLFDDLVLTYIV